MNSDSKNYASTLVAEALFIQGLILSKAPELQENYFFIKPLLEKLDVLDDIENMPRKDINEISEKEKLEIMEQGRKVIDKIKTNLKNIETDFTMKFESLGESGTIFAFMFRILQSLPVKSLDLQFFKETMLTNGFNTIINSIFTKYEIDVRDYMKKGFMDRKQWIKPDLKEGA